MLPTHSLWLIAAAAIGTSVSPVLVRPARRVIQAISAAKCQAEGDRLFRVVRQQAFLHRERPYLHQRGESSALDEGRQRDPFRRADHNNAA
jgi:hypothetical protein